MRNVKVFALMGVIAVTAAGCGQKQEAAPKNDTSVVAETSQMAETRGDREPAVGAAISNFSCASGVTGRNRGPVCKIMGTVRERSVRMECSCCELSRRFRICCSKYRVKF